MDQENFNTYTEKRREHLYNIMREAAFSRMEQALPAIEQVVLHSPLMDQTEFEKKLTKISQEHSLNEEQQSICRCIFGNYQKDIDELREYRNMILPEVGHSSNPTEDIANNDEAKSQLLLDIGITNEDKSVDLQDFTIDTSFPACLIITFTGKRDDLNRAMNEENRDSDTAGFFVLNFELDDDELTDPIKSKRIPLLNKKVIMVKNDPYDPMHINVPDITKKHELLHYAFSTYLKNEIPETTEDYLDKHIRDEMHSYFGAERNPHLTLDAFLPRTYPSYFSNTESDFFNNEEQLGRIFDLFFLLKKIEVSQIDASDKIKWMALSSKNILDLNQKLLKVAVSSNIQETMIRMGDVCPDKGDFLQARENLAWLNTWMSKASTMISEEQDKAEDFVQVMEGAIETFLDEKVVGVFGFGRDEIYTEIPPIVEKMRELESQWQQLFPAIRESLQKAIDKSLEKYNQEKYREKEQKFWNEFVLQAVENDGELGQLAQEYLSIEGRTLGVIIARSKIKKSLEESFGDWLNESGKRKELEKPELE